MGITKLLPEWEIIIQQIGLAYEIISLEKSILLDQYSVIIVTRKEPIIQKNVVLEYLNCGGSILTEADVAEWLFGISTVPAFVNTIEPYDDSIFTGVFSGFIQKKLFIPKKAHILEGDFGEKLVQIHTSGEGTAIILPGGLSNAILNYDVKRRNFPTRASHLPSERVARISKQTIREVVQKSLEYLHIVRQLPFLCLYPFPSATKSIFNFRIDTDFASAKAIDSFYQLCQNNEISATWFVETKSARDRIEQFSHMQNQEIGLHCYTHIGAYNYSFNKSDISKGANILYKANIPFCGYAAPYGEWNISLAKAIEEKEFIYSSEFTLDYDNLPFYPYFNNHFSSVLQVPVHPISLGRLKNARHNEDDIINYYIDVVQKRIDHNLPVFIYDHPSKENVTSINWLLQYIREIDIPIYSLRDYAIWWKKRLELKWVPNFNKGRIDIQCQQLDFPIYLLIKKSLEDSSVIKISNTINLGEIKWEKQSSSSNPTIPMAKRMKFNRKMIINDIIYFYRRLKQWK